MKTYAVWIKVSIEEYDDETDQYRDVALDLNTGEVFEFDDADQFKILDGAGIEEADALAQSVEGRL